MKRLLQTFVLILFSIFILYLSDGCKKATSPNGKVKGETYLHQFSDTTIIDTISYTYDQKGRVVLIQHINGNETYSFSSSSYTYTNVLGTQITGLFNNQGLIASGSNGYTYNYDENGYLISSIDSNLSNYYTIDNGNIVGDSEIFNENIGIFSYSYINTIDYRDFGMSFYGKRSRNLESFYNSSGAPETTFTYTFDNQGRVSTSTESGNHILFINKYTYFD